MSSPIESLYSAYLASGGVATDTRQIGPNALFFALKGKNFNGNEFAGQALEKGARYAVVDEAAYAVDERYLLVNDTLRALQQLARHHRRQLMIPFLAIGGSNGKTTTKELIHAVLRQRYRTYATQGNLNNHIGVPLTLLAIDQRVEIAVIEMGADRGGEMTELLRIGEPTHGLITNIGKEHLETFGGLEGVMQGEGELYDFLSESQEVVFINSREPLLREVETSKPRHFSERIRFPEPGDYLRCELLESSPFVVYRHENGQRVETQLTGAYNFENVAAALCVGKYFEVPPELANAAVAAYQPENNRSQIVRKGTNTVLLDAYNANPSSVEAALRNFRTLKAEKKVVILGDMLELGDYAPAEHRRVGELVAESGFGTVILCGPLMQHALEVNPGAYYFPDKFSLHNWLADHPFAGAHVLVKGSRSLRLESVLPFIAE
ncbi:MAG: UDP-N-acetylmuramoyl-tripeptide--D-alanyl-D-alanine ligase [Ferruginibacter sp.]|nr:UDP-N-acetylmuramoyl-tripeptide--D-alanyl-D-alanine ligase [Cytophagales bacterium]